MHKNLIMLVVTTVTIVGVARGTCPGDDAAILGLRAFVARGGGGFAYKIAIGTHPINCTIQVERSSITIEGTIMTSLNDTTLQRTSTLNTLSIMHLVPGIGNVWIKDLTFDGNRGGISTLTCFLSTPGNPFPVDLSMIESAGTNVLYHAQIINSPGIALALGYRTRVSQSTFNNARTYGIWEQANSSNYGGSFDHNTFEYTGTNAMYLSTLSSSYTNTGGFWFANAFDYNHDEFIFGSGGGQVFNSTGVSNLTLASNAINGHFITGTVGSNSPSPYHCVIPGSPTGTIQSVTGMELHGVQSLSLYNNSVANHNVEGISMDSASGTVLVSTYDPNCVGCFVNNIGSNRWHGVNVWGNTTTASFTFDGIEATYNGSHQFPCCGLGSGIHLDNGAVPYTVTFAHNACLSNNLGGRVNQNTPSNVTVLGLPSSDTCPTH